MAAHTQNLSVVDVYDIAASIGKEFETLIDNHGPEAVTELMPKVISVLEHLENLAAKNQKENAEIGELRYAVEKLQAEKVAKAEQRERYEKVSLGLLGGGGSSCLLWALTYDPSTDCWYTSRLSAKTSISQCEVQGIHIGRGFQEWGATARCSVELRK